MGNSKKRPGDKRPRFKNGFFTNSICVSIPLCLRFPIFKIVYIDISVVLKLQWQKNHMGNLEKKDDSWAPTPAI